MQELRVIRARADQAVGDVVEIPDGAQFSDLYYEPDSEDSSQRPGRIRSRRLRGFLQAALLNAPDGPRPAGPRQVRDAAPFRSRLPADLTSCRGHLRCGPVAGRREVLRVQKRDAEAEENHGAGHRPVPGETARAGRAACRHRVDRWWRHPDGPARPWAAAVAVPHVRQLRAGRVGADAGRTGEPARRSTPRGSWRATASACRRVCRPRTTAPSSR